MHPVGILIFALVEREMLDQRLAIDAHAFLPGAADRLVALLAGDVDDIDRHACGVRDHDGAVGGFAFDLGRTRIGVRLGTGNARIDVFLLERGDHVAVFGMHERQCAQRRATLERREHLVVVDHQRALVRHEALEGLMARATTFSISSKCCFDQPVTHICGSIPPGMT